MPFSIGSLRHILSNWTTWHEINMASHTGKGSVCAFVYSLWFSIAFCYIKFSCLVSSKCTEMGSDMFPISKVPFRVLNGQNIWKLSLQKKLPALLICSKLPTTRFKRCPAAWFEEAEEGSILCKCPLASRSDDLATTSYICFDSLVK